MNDEKEITPTGDGLPEGFDADLLSQLTPEERAALEEMSLTLHADPDAPVDMEADADGEDDADAGIVLQEAAAAPVMYAASRSSGSDDADELIRLLREEMRDDSISPARLADIFDAVRRTQGGAGLTDEERNAITTSIEEALNVANSAAGTADDALSTANSAAGIANDALSKADANAELIADLQNTIDSLTKTLTELSGDIDALKKKVKALEDDSHKIWIGSPDAYSKIAEKDPGRVYFLTET